MTPEIMAQIQRIDNALGVIDSKLTTGTISGTDAQMILSAITAVADKAEAIAAK